MSSLPARHRLSYVAAIVWLVAHGLARVLVADLRTRAGQPVCRPRPARSNRPRPIACPADARVGRARADRAARRRRRGDCSSASAANRRRQDEVRNFFMSFTHDLKTSLASLQLQAESLREDLPEAAANANLDRLLKDARAAAAPARELAVLRPAGRRPARRARRSARARPPRRRRTGPSCRVRIDGGAPRARRRARRDQRDPQSAAERVGPRRRA